MKHSLIHRVALMVSLMGMGVILIFYASGPERAGSAVQAAPRQHRTVESARPATGSQAPIAGLDFEIVGGRIYVPAEVNGHKISAVLDTGAAASVLDLRLADEWDLPSQGELNARGVGNEPAKGKFLSDVKISIGHITEPICCAVPLGSLTAREGRRLEAIIGYHFFQTHIVEIDYAKRHLRIFDGRADIPSKGMTIPIHLVHNTPHITSEMVIGSSQYKLEAKVDTGGSVTGLTAKFLKAHPLNVTTTAKTVVAGGVGGHVEGRFFRPDSVKLGSVSLAKPVMMLTETTGGALGPGALYDINIGADLLRRFRVTFDYPHRRVVLEPGDEVSNPFEADKTGLRIYAQGPDLRSFKVVGVLPDSSSDNAGIKVDDIIETVDGVQVSNFTLQQLRDLFRSPTAPKWELGIRRGDRRLKLTVLARSII